jgi:regulator of sigma E protease
VAAARSGLEDLLSLLAFLSVNIAVLNLLPIPVLDGGQVLLNVLEAAKGSAFSLRTREYILRVGLVAIGLLFITVMWNDVARWAADLVK